MTVGKGAKFGGQRCEVLVGKGAKFGGQRCEVDCLTYPQVLVGDGANLVAVKAGGR